MKRRSMVSAIVVLIVGALGAFSEVGALGVFSETGALDFLSESEALNVRAE